MKIILIVLLVLGFGKSFAGSLDEDVQKIMVNVEIAKLYSEDQAVRKGLSLLLKKGHSMEEVFDRPDFGGYWSKMDKRNTKRMKEIIAEWGWPKISDFGKEADRQAWLLVQHADHDVEFQKSVLVTLQELLAQDETNPKNYAYLFDRVQVNTGKPQMYGTQGLCVGPGRWEPREIKDRDQVDERRDQVGLESLSEYIEIMNRYCL